MNDAIKLAESMRNAFKGPLQFEIATVKSVNEIDLTCVVQLWDDTEITDVRLKAAIDNVTDGLVQIPLVTSTVIVGRIGNDDSTRFVALFSNVTKVVFYGGENGGLVKWPDLKSELNKTNEVVQAIVDALTNWTVAPGDGGGALKTLVTSGLAGKVVGNYEGKENNKVLH